MSVDKAYRICLSSIAVPSPAIRGEESLASKRSYGPVRKVFLDEAEQRVSMFKKRLGILLSSVNQ